jgi:hypothetical protein
MANWYSDHFGTDGSADSTIASPKKIVQRGLSGDGKLIRRASITVLDSALGDVLWMFTVGSGDRLLSLTYGSDGGFNSSSSNELGLYTHNDDHDGAVLDVDLFGAGIDLTSAVDASTEALYLGAIDGEDRGKQMWELLELGADQGKTADPGLKYDVCLTLNANDDATSSTFILVAEYTAGG